ncbi:MAG: TlyA family RNA methyltransferase [Puniceicoccales bacterium]
MSASGKKVRLDQLLLARGLCESRNQARGMILAGKVRTGTTILDKPGKEFPNDLPLEIEEPPRFVSRAGEKLAGFLDQFGYDPQGLTILDVGASTGGFTDCALQRGAVHSTCVDVGRAQLHQKLRLDPRVSNHERLHASALPETELPHTTYDWIVMDLSFISLKKVLPSVWPRLKNGGLLITLVKPQFEATREEADRGKGIIRDSAVRERILGEVIDFAIRELPGCQILERAESTLAGTDGNLEYLVSFRRAD